MSSATLKVQLISSTIDAVDVVAIGAKRCYSGKTNQELIDEIKNMPPDKKDAFIARTVERGHTSVLEHANFTFTIEGMSRVALAQLTRHRHASFGVMSQRYTETATATEVQGDDEVFDSFTKYHISYVIPDSILKKTEAQHKYESLFTYAAKVYKELEALGIPAEDARYVIPAGVETRLTITANARELMHFFALRCCSRAQTEMRHIANAMLRECKKHYPTLFAKAGASCVQLGYCPEGKGCCGRAKTLDEILANQLND